MAIKLPKFFTGADAKTRVFFLFAAVVAVGVVIYLGVDYFSGGGAATTGPSKVATAPSELKSVPGGQLSPEYYRALVQANAQASKQAEISGGSAVPTLINVPGQGQPTANCTILCPSEENANVADDINALVKSGKLSQKDADMLLDLAKRNVPIEEYAAALDELVREGKLTPEEARALLEKYKKQHENALLNESAAMMDGMIKSGQLPLDVANALLDLQKRHVTPAEYAAYLDKLVREGKLTPAEAAALLAQYTQQYAREQAKKGAFELAQMAKSGQITPDVAKLLQDLQDKNIPVDQYAAELNRLVAEGKMTPATAKKLLDMYRAQRSALNIISGCLGDTSNKTGDVAAFIQQLINLQVNNASVTDYSNQLKAGVVAGYITPDQATCLISRYQALVLPFTAGAAPTIETNIPTTSEFAKLQQKVQQRGAVTAAPPTASTEEFAAAAAQAQAVAAQERAQRVAALQAAMNGQAQALINSWQVVKMAHVAGTAATEAGKGGTAAGISGTTTTTTTTTKPTGPSIIKAGSILFAILETAVDSDYPDTPVMASIVQEGPFKGAKLIGKLNLAQGQEKVSLNFTLMDMDQWMASKTVSAFAIDPETARTVLATDVDHHYLLRYGAIMATSFLSGYSNAITQEGTSTTGIFGTSTSHPSLSPGNKLAVAFGQIGTNLNSTVQTFVNTPTTVKVSSGVAVGILFTAPVTE